jgi:hypothetical protein
VALNGRRRRQLLETATPLLIQGELVELTTLANVGSVSVRKQALTAAVVGVLTAGTVLATVRPRQMYIVLTEQRLLFFDGSTATGKPGKLLINLPRPYVSVSEPRKGLLGLTLVTQLSVAEQDKGLKLSFPTPCRAEGRQFAAALPKTR